MGWSLSISSVPSPAAPEARMKSESARVLADMIEARAEPVLLRGQSAPRILARGHDRVELIGRHAVAGHLLHQHGHAARRVGQHDRLLALGAKARQQIGDAGKHILAVVNAAPHIEQKYVVPVDDRSQTVQRLRHCASLRGLGSPNK
jgi:hypothetical protein